MLRLHPVRGVSQDHLEQELYSQFVLLINEKKRKIRDLENENTQLLLQVDGCFGPLL